MARTTARGHALYKVKRRDGSTVWRASKDVGWLDGKRQRLERYGRTGAEASRRLLAALAERERAQHGQATVTVERFVLDWLEDIIEPNRAPRTVDSYSGVIQRHILPAFGHKELRAVQAADLQRLYATLQRAGHPATAKIAHNVLRQCLRLADDRGLLDRSPLRGVVPPRPPTPRRQSLTPEQARVLLAALSALPDGAAYVVAVTAGLRLGELAGLPWARVDWQAPCLHVTQQVQWTREPPSRPYLCPPKDDSVRSVPLLPIAVEALRVHQERQAAQREAWPSPFWSHWGLVFPRADGYPQRDSVLRKRWHGILAGLNLPRLPPHAARHSFVSLLGAAGVQVEVAAKLAGHKNTATTLAVYRHIQAGETEAAMGRLGALLEGPPGDGSGADL